MVLELVHKDQKYLGLRKQRGRGKPTLPNLIDLSSNHSPASHRLQITPTLLASLPASAKQSDNSRLIVKHAAEHSRYSKMSLPFSLLFLEAVRNQGGPSTNFMGAIIQ